MDSKQTNSTQPAPHETPPLPTDPVVVRPIHLPIKEPSNGNRRTFIIVLIIAILLIVGAAVYFMLNRPKAETPASPVASVQPEQSPKVTQKPCKFGVDEHCPITKQEYTLVAKHVSLIKGGSLSDSDAATKQDITKISTYLDKSYPDINFVLVGSYDSSNDTEKATSYRAFEIVNGAVVELSGLVPQLRVGVTATLDLSDGAASVTTPAVRQSIVTTKALAEPQIITAIEDKIAKLTDKQKQALYTNTPSDRVVANYSLVWTEKQGLIYRIALNASTLTLNANTGSVLAEDWSSGIIN